MNIKNRIKFILTIFIFFMCWIVTNPLQVKAGTAVTTTTISFDEHQGMVVHIGNVDGYCVQRGYPFRTYVSDLQSMYVTEDGKTMTLAEWIRVNLSEYDEDGNQLQFFAGWGTWKLNDTASNVTNVTTDKSTVPSSGAWTEGFDEETVDGEDSYVKDTDNSTTFNPGEKTGHEGSKDKYSTEMVKVTGTLSTSRLKALAMANYYIFHDPDVSGISLYAKRQTAGALTWAAEFGYLDSTTTTVGSSSITTVTFNSATGKYKKNGSMKSEYMTCDEYIKKYIGKKYDAMKLYRHFVWAVTNLRVIPSFAYDSEAAAKDNPIHLKWDASLYGGEGGYYARVSDEKGVLDYFDFDIEGITITDNGDGSLTLKCKDPIDTTFVSSETVVHCYQKTVHLLFLLHMHGN